MAQEDPEQVADELERDREEMARRSGELQDQVQETRDDWERKRSDESVPGAPQPEGEEAEAAEDSEEAEDDGPEEGPETTGKA